MLKVLLVIPFLAGCMGYKPLYEQASAARTEQVQLGVVEMTELEEGVGARRAAQQVRQELLRVFPLQGGDYTLNIAIRERVGTLAVRRDATDQRLELRLRGQVRLENAAGERLLVFSASTEAAYNVGTSPYATDAGKVQARRTASRALSEEVALRVRRYLATVEESNDQEIK